MDTGRRFSHALLRHLDAALPGRPDAELIAQVLSGADPPPAVLAAAERLAVLPLWERRTLGAAGLARDHHLSPGQALRLAALWELAERWYPDERPSVNAPQAALHLLQPLRLADREEVWSILLDARHRLLGVSAVVIGCLNSARLQPRDVLTPALRSGAAAMVVAHNHPSGDSSPSRADRVVTAALREAARLIGLPLLDHIIVTARSHYSFRETEQWESDLAA